jgi:predicted transcriptional regulator
MNLRKKVTNSSFFAEYVKILNGVLQLSNREVEVLSFLLTADANGYNDNVNVKEVRELIRGSVGISEANLSKYLGVLKSKNLIVRSPNNKWVINDYIRPVSNNNIFELAITLEIENYEKEESKVEQYYQDEHRG